MTETEDDGPAGRAPRGLLTARAAAQRIAELEAELAEAIADGASLARKLADAREVCPEPSHHATVARQFEELRRLQAEFAESARIGGWTYWKARAEKAEAEVKRLNQLCALELIAGRAAEAAKGLFDLELARLGGYEGGGRESGGQPGRAEAVPGDPKGNATSVAAANPAARKERDRP